MPPASRFGASKYRNAVPHVPHKDEWYRSSLPVSSTSTSPTSTFSSEIKTNRHGIFTLTTSGDFSFRPYDGQHGSVKSQKGIGGGGGVGDWDVSGLESGRVIVGGLDGSVSVYSFVPDDSESLDLARTIPGSGSPVSNLVLHPTTPDLVLVSTASGTLSIYNLASENTSPAITLSCPEPKGLWSIAWSADGKRLAAVGKSGTGYIYDPRSGVEPVTKRLLPMQPLKPSRIIWIGDKVLVTSTSKMRNREYSAFKSSDMSTVFTQTLDTSPGLLIPLVDEERNIVYLTGKGDSTLRQVELSGPQGFQETLHALPSPLPSGSFSLAHPATLPVMQAQIATVLIPTSDKEGDAIIPFGIRVPRRQLIDYHDDLFPDIVGTVPEQSADEWLKGGDEAPSSISLDPSRRGFWEEKLAHSATRKSSSNQQQGATRENEPKSQPTPGAIPSAAGTSPSPAIQPATATTVSSPAATDPSLPPLEKDETYASTSYKVRVIGNFITEQVDRHKKAGGKGPIIIGLQGPQGCGKTTLSRALLDVLTSKPINLNLAVLSLDDLYQTHSGLRTLATKHSDNSLLQGRGPPGTHDVQLASQVLSEIQKINDEPNTTVSLPVFDKSLRDGEGDRSSQTVPVQGPLDVFILEGWSVGFGPLSQEDLQSRYKSKSSLTDTSFFIKHPLSSLDTLNHYLDQFANAVYPSLGAIVVIEPKSYKYVFDWRLEQERTMKSQNGGKGMDDEQIHGFVERYMPGYELWKGGVRDTSMTWAGNGLVLTFGEGREVTDVARLAAPKVDQSAQVQGRSEKNDIGKEANTPTKAEPVKRSAPAKAVNPTWSRKFLAGKSPLIPTYDQVPAISTLHQDSQILKCTSRLAFFPISGPGGRLAVHPLSKKGRMDNSEQFYLSGGVDISDFAVEHFGDDICRVVIAGEDGIARMWNVDGSGLSESGKEPDATLQGDSSNKITQVAFHPTAKDLLSGAASDAIYLFDLSKRELALTVQVEAQGGAYNVSWSPRGDRLAIALKDKRMAVLDPRKPSQIIYGQAHDSPRSFQIEWLDETHLISVGFARGSMRKIILYQLAGETIITVSSLSIDTSPSVLFPSYDPDTSVLYVWGKGERQIQAYEIHPENKVEPIARLPGFTAGSPQLGLTFLPKRMVDVKKVEVAKALRLTAKSIEEVSFTIPRNRPDFFQDDIFRDTLDNETPSQTAEEWLGGEDAEHKYLNLCPPGMTALSVAPQTPAKNKPKFVPAKDIMTEEEKKKQEMDKLFARAKLDDSSDEEDGPPKSGLDPPDDDW
ncbi:putative actin cross-linking [Kockovaella imperatae]|uniref:Putative actin cross-linking n=1 Tax=Kockovaella imperatae TaxID=4999 RepID=A0A1Y1URE1_9TREE|nr:putative actin cross-linking [Kockovaella imperatae]ORX39705.1 putative actin cross-linking [Kockovaella imperatae]